MSQIAYVRKDQGNIDEALWTLKEVVAAFDRLKDEGSRAVALTQIAEILIQRRELPEALRILRQEVVPVTERLGDARETAVAQSKIADILLLTGRLDEARRVLETEVLPYNERVGALDGLAFVSFKLGQILIGQDKPHDALPRIERAFDTVHRLQHLRGVVAIGDVYFKLLMRLGELARASEVARSVAAAAKSLSSG